MTTLERLGDAALQVSVAGDALAANAVVHRLARALTRASLPGVRGIVPGMTTLIVHVDPLRVDAAAIAAIVNAGSGLSGAWLNDAVLPDAAPPARRHEVPVRYGGAFGPDLDAVATAAGLSPAEVVERHRAVDYRVCFLGFLPGFAYLGLVHASLRIARRATPRTRVPAGAVAIADVFTGVYPTESPGGWHLIGQTDLPLFDATSPTPSRFMPGDVVRFVDA